MLNLALRTDDVNELPARERFVGDISWLEAEYMNGGTDQVFYNSSGCRIKPMMEALQAIGATRTAASLRRAANLFPNGLPSVDTEVRRSQMDVIRQPNQRVFDQFPLFEEDVFGLLLDYWKKNEPPLDHKPDSTKNKRAVFRLFVELPLTDQGDYDKLTERERFLWHVCFFAALTSGKGELQSYVMAPESADAPALAVALNKIGAARTAAIVTKMLSFYPGGQPSTDPLQRLKQALPAMMATGKAFANIEVNDGVVKGEGWEEDLFALMLKYWEKQ
jgi:hypothetical protein